MRLAVKLELEDDRRAHARAITDAPSTVRSAPARFDAIVHDLSCGGCSIELDADLAVGEAVLVSLVGLPMIRAIIQWREGNRYGCRFGEPLAQIEWGEIGRDNLLTPSSWSAEPDAERGYSDQPVAKRVLVIVALSVAAWLPVVAAIWFLVH